MDEIVRLIEAEIPSLRRYARALLRNQERADDLLQDTLLRGLDKIRLYRPGTDLRAWLFTIMHNQYVNTVRHSIRHGPTIVVEEMHLASPPAQTQLLELRDLDRAVQRLPPEQRATLLMIALEGMQYEEVARICGVPTGTVRSRLNRAREGVRRMMEGGEARAGVVMFRERARAVDAKPVR